MIVTSAMWCSLSEWRANEAHQCQGLSQASLCPGASYDGGQAPALSSSTPNTDRIPVKAQKPPGSILLLPLIPFLSPFLQSLPVSDVGEAAVITFLGKG